MIHLHGPHDCYCPACHTVVTAEESVQCSGMDCPDCGTRMRALDIGEQRLEPLEVLGHSPSELPEGLALMEAAMFTGEKARLTFCTDALPAKEDLNYIYDEMKAEGCHVSKPTASLVGGIPTTEFVLRKGSPAWLAIIPIIVPLFTIGLIAWGVAKIEDIKNAIVPIILILGGMIIVVAVVLREPATKYIERGGKLLPETREPNELELRVKRLWAKQCEWEKVSPDEKFVVFSDDNPYVKQYNEAISQLLRFKQFKSGQWKPAVTKSSKKALAVK